ncbi:MAG: hypothetical protein V1808_03760 [Candidatus Daviesbacteria bacterium]
MIKNNDYIKEFKVDLSCLTKDELVVLEKLVEAAKLIAQVYIAQLKDGFYPKDATRQEIEKAASKDSEILSPYTIVKRDSSGKLITIPYHEQYHSLLEPIAQKLKEAAEEVLHHPDFKKMLLIQAKALLNGNYDQAETSWKKIKPFILDIVIGPLERIEDNMFFTKRSYQAWVGVMNKNVTNRFSTLKDIVYSARRQAFPSERVDLMEKAQLRMDETVIFSGMIANYQYTATTLPNDIDLLEKYGSEGWIFLPSLRENFEDRQYKLFNLIFAPFFKASFSKEELFRGYMLIAAMHEIARIIVRYRFAVSRLRELYPVFNELTTEALGVKMMGTLLIKDVISQKELESALVMFLTRMFDGYHNQISYKSGLGPLMMGNAILMNSLVESGAVKITDEGISWPNFTKMFFSVSELAEAMEKIMAEGTYQDAQIYLKKHSSLAVFKKFASALKALHKA